METAWDKVGFYLDHYISIWFLLMLLVNALASYVLAWDLSRLNGVEREERLAKKTAVSCLLAAGILYVLTLWFT